MAGEETHMAEDASSELKAERKYNMNSTVLDNFTKLTNERDAVRFDGSIALLKYLFQQNSVEDKELKYALTRLIRSLGSSKTCTRKGFYSTFTVFLTLHPETPLEKILSVMEEELHPGKKNLKSENADIYMGRILVCGALIRSKLLLQNTVEVKQQAIRSLIQAGQKRRYLSFISISFLIEYLSSLDAQSLETSIWPVIQEELGKPWSEQNLDTCYALLFMKAKFPTLITKQFLKKHLGNEEIVCKESIENIIGLITDLPSRIFTHHPIWKIFVDELISKGLVADFWSCIEQKFTKPSKCNEHFAVETLKLIIPSLTDKNDLLSLLSPRFLDHMITKFSRCKKKVNDIVLTRFKECLVLLVSALSEPEIKTKTQLSVIKNLILYPGDLMIEKKTGIKVVQLITGNLKAQGVHKLALLYRSIIENTISKGNPDSKISVWTNAERTYAAQMLTKLMGHSEMTSDNEWRLDQFKFLFKYGLCEVLNVGVELAHNFKESFYRALDHKLTKLNVLRSILSDLVHYLNQEFKSERLKLRTALSDEASEAWEQVVQSIEELEKDSKDSVTSPIFHTMNLHMGLQLFSDSEIAIMSINELKSCLERLRKKSKKKKNNDSSQVTEEEPEWVEVVVDLLLCLLSKNSHLLRSLVGCVFPHICTYLTTEAVYQILEVFDVKSNKGPLTAKDAVDDDTSSDDEEEESDKDENMENGDANSGEDNNVGSSDDDVSNADEGSGDEDETVTDRLRLAVRQALGDATAQTDDEDIDVDDIDDDEGKRLDQSLAAAFKILKENRQSRVKKQEKSAQTLTHFRVRVIDLLDDYLDSCPPMAIVLDMLVPLFALLEFCIKDPHQKPLEHRVRACLKKLAAVKKFKHTDGVDDELLTTILKALIEKGERTASVCQEMGDKLSECCTFLIRCVQYANLTPNAVVKIYEDNLTAFFKKRDCILPAILFKSVLQLCWEGNWQLAPLLVDFAFDSTIRSFRRSQAVEFLTIFYRNNRLIHSNTEHSKVRLAMEKELYKNSINMFREISDESNNSNDKKEIKEKFFCLLLILLHVVYPQHLPKAWNWQELGSALTAYRNKVSLAKDAKSAFNKLAAQIGVNTNVSNRKRKKSESISETNGQSTSSNENQLNISSDVECTDDEKESAACTKRELKKKKKNKGKQKQKQMLKKEARELRAKSMSEGLQSFSFSSVVLANGVDGEETIQNGNLDSNDVSNHSQSKTSIDSSDAPTKPKRKKSIENA